MSHQLTVERVFQASAEAVFDAFTSADAQRVWMRDPHDPNAIVESECDPRVGGRWVAAWGPSRDELDRETNVFQVVDRPRRLVMSTTSSTPDGFTLDTRTEVTFQEQDGRTRMMVVQSGLPTAELRDYFQTTAWPGALEALHAYVTKEQLP